MSEMENRVLCGKRRGTRARAAQRKVGTTVAFTDILNKGSLLAKEARKPVLSAAEGWGTLMFVL
jgi:hypothetical protein